MTPDEMYRKHLELVAANDLMVTKHRRAQIRQEVMHQTLHAATDLVLKQYGWETMRLLTMPSAPAALIIKAEERTRLQRAWDAFTDVWSDYILPAILFGASVAAFSVTLRFL